MSIIIYQYLKIEYLLNLGMDTLVIDCANLFFFYRDKKYKNFRSDRFKPYILNNFLKDYKKWMNETIELNKNFYLIFVQKFHSIEILEEEYLEEFRDRCRFIYISIDWERIDNLRVNKEEMKLLKQYDDFLCIKINEKIRYSSILSRDRFRNYKDVANTLRYLNIEIYDVFDIGE